MTIGIKLRSWILLFLRPDRRRTSEYVMVLTLLLADGLTSWIHIPSCVSAGARRTWSCERDANPGKKRSGWVNSYYKLQEFLSIYSDEPLPLWINQLRGYEMLWILIQYDETWDLLLSGDGLRRKSEPVYWQILEAIQFGTAKAGCFRSAPWKSWNVERLVAGSMTYHGEVALEISVWDFVPRQNS